MLRQQRGRDSSTASDILVEALGALGEAGGDPDQVARVLGDMVRSNDTARKILEAAGEPSAVQRALGFLVNRDETRRCLTEAGGSADSVRGVLVELIRSGAAKRKLVVYTSARGARTTRMTGVQEGAGAVAQP